MPFLNYLVLYTCVRITSMKKHKSIDLIYTSIYTSFTPTAR